MFFCPLQRVLKPKPNAKMQLISQTLHHKLKKYHFFSANLYECCSAAILKNIVFFNIWA